MKIKNLFAETASIGSYENSVVLESSSYAATASLLLGSIESASYALTSSYALNGGSGGGGDFSTGSYTGSFTGSYTGSFTGSLLGTASYSNTASLLLGSIESASYALTASYAANGGSGGGGDFSTGSYTGSFTGSLLGTASYASTASLLLGSIESSSYAATSSYVPGTAPATYATFDTPVALASSSWTSGTYCDNPSSFPSALDGNPATYWTPNHYQIVGDTFEIDFGSQIDVRSFRLDNTNNPNDKAKEIKVETSTDESTWTERYATYDISDEAVVNINFDSLLNFRYLRLSITVIGAGYWVINEFSAYEQLQSPTLPANARGWANLDIEGDTRLIPYY